MHGKRGDAFFLEETNTQGEYLIWSRSKNNPEPYFLDDDWMGCGINDIVHVVQLGEKSPSGTEQYRIRLGVRALILLARNGYLSRDTSCKAHGCSLKILDTKQ